MLSDLKVKYFNARSLRNKLPSLHSILYNDHYSIICVSESWLNNFITDGLLDPRGLYNIYRRDRIADNPSGGVCIFVNRNLNSSMIEVDYSFYSGAEIIACNIYDNQRVYVTIVCCYMAPAISNNSFLTSINCLRHICAQGPRVLLLGDCNLPNIDWNNEVFSSDYKSQLFFEFYCDFGFYQYIHESTRKSNVLDLLLSNDPLIVSSYCIDVPFCNSDHDSINCVIFIDKQCHMSSDNVSSSQMWDWKKLIGILLILF